VSSVAQAPFGILPPTIESTALRRRASVENPGAHQFDLAERSDGDRHRLIRSASITELPELVAAPTLNRALGQ
jgi:hypothetical protein